MRGQYWTRKGGRNWKRFDNLWRTHRNRRWLFPNRHGDAPINKRVLSDTFAAAAEAAGSSAG